MAVPIRSFGAIDVAEDAVQHAVAVAVQRRPAEGVPPSPAGWIITTAHNRAINQLRREASRADRHAQAARLALQAAGHEVYALTLTGLGERSHLASPDIDLDTHIQDVVNVLEHEDLRDVVLLGASYGGMVVTAVADRAADTSSRRATLDRHDEYNLLFLLRSRR